MNAGSIEFDPIPGWPQWVVLAVVSLVFFAWLGWHNSARLGGRRAAVLTGSRLLGVTLLLLLLLRPSRREELPLEKKNHVILAGIDVSHSMDQPDAGYAKRLDAAVRLIDDAGLDSRDFRLRLFGFDEDAKLVAPDKLVGLKAEGTDTRVHTSVVTMLQSLQKDESPAALFLLTDGHDFEMTSPAKTALAARARSMPIYTVPMGAAGKVRDVSMRIANYQPYCYINQKARVSAIARFTGCENEFVAVQLLRDGKVIETKQIATREEAEAPVDFIVTEPAAGQFEYEVRAQPVYGETVTANNSAITYLNVLDDKIRVLMVEGAPYWDSTFLQRTLMRNDKIDLDAVIQYSPKQARRIRKSPGLETLALPATREDFKAYDVVILGSKVGQLLDAGQQAALMSFVLDDTGIVICARGPTGLAPEAAAVLEPVVWESITTVEGDLNVSREGRSSPPFQLLSSFRSDDRALPPLTAAWQVKEVRTLAATLAVTRGSVGQGGPDFPAFIHRPAGRGQVLGVGAGDLWHWAFQSDATAREALFDRLWDQIIVWMVASSDRSPGAQNRLRTSAANLPLGEEVRLRLQFKGTTPPVAPVVSILAPDGTTAQVTMTPTNDPMAFEAGHVSSQTGRYRAEITLPDGKKEAARFMVYQENREATEVSADRTYLKKLAESSGGQMLEPGDFPGFLKTLKASLQPADKRFRMVSLWDQPWVLYVLISFFALDWYLRRRWGLT